MACSTSAGGIDASPAPPEASTEETSGRDGSADAPAESSAEAAVGSDGSDAATE
jgi:hypothetical protein